MALRGNLRDFSLPDVFQLVAFSHKTGVLRIEREGAHGSVWFRDGEVFFAQSDWHHEPLGQRLVTAEKITASALAKSLEIQQSESEDRRLGGILVAEGYITESVLEAFVQEQIQDTIFDLFRWEEGDFHFEPLELPAEQDIGLSVSIENIVMEGSRRLEEWNRIKKKVPSMDLVFKMATAPGEGTFEISLKPVEWSLLLKVDGTRTVAELARETGRTDFEVARIVYGLFSAGLLEVASEDEVERLRKERAEHEERIAALRRERETVRSMEQPEATVEEPAAAEAERAEREESPEQVEERPEPEVPAFLMQDGRQASDADMAVFEEMVGAVLEAHPDPESEPEPEPEPEPDPVPEPEPEPEPEPKAERGVAAETPQRTGDLEADLRAMGLGEPPTSDLLDPVADAPDEATPPSEEPAAPEVTTEPEELAPPERSAVPEPPEASERPTAPEVAEPTPEVAHEGGSDQPQEDSSALDELMTSLSEQYGEVSDEAGIAAPEAPTEEETPEPAAEEETPEPAAEEATPEPPAAPEAPEESEEAPAVAETEEMPSGVISTDQFLEDIDTGDTVGLSSGLGSELTALTGAEASGGGGRKRPQTTVNKLPEAGSEVKRIHADEVDRGVVEQIIEGIERL